MSTILLQRFANREYRLTRQNIYSGKKKGGDKYVEKQAEKYAVAVRDTYVLQQELQQGEAALISDGRLKRRSFGEVDARLGIRALDIINEFQTANKCTTKGGWGTLSKPTSFTKNARHRLLEAGAIVDKFCGLNAYEVTCTLPGSTSESMRLLAEHTGWIMNELTQKIRRAGCKYWFYVWEYQKRGALHLHLLIADPEKDLKSLALSLESRWWELLKFMSAKKGVDVFSRRTGGTWAQSPTRWQSHVAPIKKSVAAYFSKYAGKGSCNSSKKWKSQKMYCPSRWWGCSTTIKEQIKLHRQKYVISLSNSSSVDVFLYLREWLSNGGLLRRYEYKFDLGVTAMGTALGGGHVCIGYYDDVYFARMQTWEKHVWDDVLAMAKDAGEYEDSTQTWTNEDFECRHPLYADMDKRRYDLSNADMSRHTASHPPHSQPLSVSRKLSTSRGTQPQATLDLRARLVQFLGGGDGENPLVVSRCKTPTEYIQGTLFDTNYYASIDKGFRSYEI